MSNGFYKTTPGYLSKVSAESESARLGIEREIEAERERDAKRNAWYKNSFLGALALSKIRNSITQQQVNRFDEQGRPMYQLKEDTPFWKGLWRTKSDYEKINYGAKPDTSTKQGQLNSLFSSYDKNLPKGLRNSGYVFTSPAPTPKIPLRAPGTNLGIPNAEQATKITSNAKQTANIASGTTRFDNMSIPDTYRGVAKALSASKVGSTAPKIPLRAPGTSLGVPAASQAANKGGEAAAQSGKLLGTAGNIFGGGLGLLSMYGGLRKKNAAQIPAHMRDSATAGDVLGTISGASGVASAVPGPHQIVTAPLAGLLGLISMVT